MIDCVEFTYIRSRLFNVGNMTDLFDSVTPSTILLYVRAIGLFSRCDLTNYLGLCIHLTIIFFSSRPCLDCSLHLFLALYDPFWCWCAVKLWYHSLYERPKSFLNYLFTTYDLNLLRSFFASYDNAERLYRRWALLERYSDPDWNTSQVAIRSPHRSIGDLSSIVPCRRPRR